MAQTAADIITFWTEQVGEANWYRKDSATDQVIRDRFLALWQRARDSDTAPFEGTARDGLASVILLDQFPRNMFRDSANAFATDPLARRTSRAVIAQGFDETINMPLRQVLYMPFVHSEDLDDQIEGAAHIERGIGRAGNLKHALAHAEIIRRFGRFPFRNAVLGRDTTPEEQQFLDGGGYQRVLQEIEI